MAILCFVVSLLFSFFALTASAASLTSYHFDIEGDVDSYSWVAQGHDLSDAIVVVVDGVPIVSLDVGKTWINNDIDSAKNVVVSPSNGTFWILTGDDKFWTSNDYRISKKFQEHTIQENKKTKVVSTFKFHPNDPNFVMAFVKDANCREGSCIYEIWLTKDFCKTWEKIDNAFDAEWFCPEGVQSIILYREKELFIFNIPKSSQRSILKDVVQYFISENFIHALKSREIDDVKDFNEMYVLNQESVHNETTPFLLTNLNSNQIRNLIIVDSLSTGVILMDIPKPTDPFSNGQNIEIQDLKGNLWKSDSKGSNFIKIKDNVFVANIKGELIHEFSKVKSVPGTYIITYSSEQNDGILSEITRNQGAKWTRIKTIEQVNGNDEQSDIPLVLLGSFHKTHKDDCFVIYSEDNAPGYVLALGARVRPEDFYKFVNTDLDIGVYLSKNGGHPFQKIRDGKHYCQFLNTGSIIYCIPVGKSNKIFYTYTEDIEWKEFEFHDHEIDIIKVDSEEGIGTVALITGKTVDDTTLISVDLHSLVVRDCEQKDYVNWTPSDGREGESCMLGKKIQFQRIKEDSHCHAKEEKPKTIFACKCQEEDFECDVNFIRTAKGCILKEGFSPISGACEEGNRLVSSGYRLIPGDECDLFSPDSLHLEYPVTKSCTDNAYEFQYSYALAVGLGVTLPLTILGLGMMALVYYCRNKKKNRRRRHGNRKMNQNFEGDEDTVELLDDRYSKE